MSMDALRKAISENMGAVNVLLVDDQSFVRKIVKSVFQDVDNIRFIDAADGSEALNTLQSLSVDAVFLDINMRPTNGLEALKAIRTGQDGLRQDMPVIMLTGVSDQAAVRAAVELDSNAFILKPATPSTLLDRLTRVLSKRQPMKSAKEYARVQLPTGLDEDAIVAPRLDPKSASAPTEPAPIAGSTPGTVVVKVGIQMLRRNDRLVDDITTKNGQLMVIAGTEVDDAMLDRLTDLKDMVAAKDIDVEREPDR
ncbi:MAG: response regulator [Rhodospirillaceae bacterium]|jgi:DNA-binding NarL/FixJ family response regulator|nr:response regulator [Rhodospirillaceae bacterium]MBT6137808.1 response regulator [Rhodospirillaceae bacterium]